MVFAIWAFALVLAFAMLHWAAGSSLNVSGGPATFRTDLYLSGTTFFTLGLGDVTPRTALARVITVAEGGMGFGYLAIVISYLPTMYTAFSQREINISLLDARAGSPPTAGELLRRHSHVHGFNILTRYLQEWEIWCAQLMESHLSYPVLCYFRSQHDNQSWLAAFTTVLDTCALVMVGVDGAPVWQARMTFAMARHAVVDIAQVFRTKPKGVYDCSLRLSSAKLDRLRLILKENGIQMRSGPETEQRLDELRLMYEPYVAALSEWLLMPLPPWILPPEAIDN